MELLKNKFLIFLFVGIFLISFVSAVPPQTVQTNINVAVGIQVEFTEIPVIENGVWHLFNAHVFNISTGLRLLNDTTDCNFHLFDNKGFHIINQRPMGYDIVGLDFELNVTGGNFTRNGEYAYLIVCNTTNIGGFVAADIEVTPSGNFFGESEGILLFGIILILIFITIFFIIATIITHDPSFKVFFGSMTVLILVATIGFGVTIMQQLLSTNAIILASYTLFYRLFVILLSAAAIGLILFLVVFALRMFNKNRGIKE